SSRPRCDGTSPSPPAHGRTPLSSERGEGVPVAHPGGIRSLDDPGKHGANMTVLMAIGTGKGLYLARSEDDRKSWELSGPHFPMTAVYAAAIDRRRGSPRLLTGVTSSHWGPSVSVSDDLGETWQESDPPPV